KTVRRLVGLLLFVLLCAALLTGIWAYHERSRTRQLLADRDFGIAAFRAGDYPLAVERLRVYKDKFPEDYDAIYAYAASRLRTPSSGSAAGRNIAEAKQLFEQLHRARPDDLDASHVLLDLYSNLGFYHEAIDLADTVLSRDPRDVTALRCKASALFSSGKLQDALAASQKLNESDPLSLSG